jgi:hypothetical protein
MGLNDSFNMFFRMYLAGHAVAGYARTGRSPVS